MQKANSNISYVAWLAGEVVHPDYFATEWQLALPLGVNLDLILRYEASVHRQLVHAINQLERMQRTRKGEHVPAPVALHLSND